jgi:hypothetical protein
VHNGSGADGVSEASGASGPVGISGAGGVSVVGGAMISIVYGSPEAGLHNNWTAMSADLANDAPNICELALPTTHPPPSPSPFHAQWAKQFDRASPLSVKRGR